MTKARDIADGVDTADIADGAISTAKLADGSISTAKIADSAISSAKIADGDITDAKLASGISASKLTGALPAVDGSALTGIGGGLKVAAVTEFNTSGTWTPTANTNYVEVAAIGAGGGGAWANVYTVSGGGGGGVIRFAANRDYFGATETVTIGSGGTATLPGNTGGTTSLGNHFTLNGGTGGNGSSNYNIVATQAAGGNATTNVTAGANVPYVQSGSGGTSAGYVPNNYNSLLTRDAGDLADYGIYSLGGRSSRGFWAGLYNHIPPNTYNGEGQWEGAYDDDFSGKRENLFSSDQLIRSGGTPVAYNRWNENGNNVNILNHPPALLGMKRDGDDGCIHITEYEDS